MRLVPRLRRRALLISLLTAMPRAAAASTAVDLLLVLAVDASGSVDMDRFTLQKHGYAEAFRSAEVAAAIASGPTQAIAVTMMQWTGPRLQQQVVPWTVAHDAASGAALADAIDAAQRVLFRGGTSISGAIDRSMQLLAAAPFTAPRQVIDVSGDGANNAGRPAATARDDAVAAGVAINGLPILTLEPDLDDFYRTQVVGGPGAFVIAIHSYDQFADAIRRKLVTEIASDYRSAKRLFLHVTSGRGVADFATNNQRNLLRMRTEVCLCHASGVTISAPYEKGHCSCHF